MTSEFSLKNMNAFVHVTAAIFTCLPRNLPNLWAALGPS